MEIKITVNVGGNDPIEIKVDVPVEGEKKVEKTTEHHHTDVDFGIFAERNRGFINGTETTALLDFNVDGDILKYL